VEFKKAPNNSKYRQGKYNLINESKYLGDKHNIFYRSGYELRFMRYLDSNERVVKWGSEVNEIQYKDPEGVIRRYYPDFSVIVLDDEGFEKVYIIEVKPASETVPPKKPSRVTPKSLKNYQYAVTMYMKNICKWAHAKEWCERRGFQFIIATEDFIFGK
jgi:hypothetical protein